MIQKADRNISPISWGSKEPRQAKEKEAATSLSANGVRTKV